MIMKDESKWMRVKSGKKLYIYTDIYMEVLFDFRTR